MNQVKAKKVPMRKCVATNNQFPKSEMIRIVRTPLNEVVIDSTGKLRGHGVYLSKDIKAVELAKKKNLLSKSLEIEVKDDIYQELIKLLK